MVAQILVVEESPDLCRLFEFLLRSAGYRVRTIHDSAAAPAVLASFAPDLIIFDWSLDNAAGLQWAEALRGEPLGESVPMLFLCGGLPARNEQARLAQLGIALAEKPFDIHRLCAQVAQLLGERERALGST